MKCGLMVFVGLVLVVIIAGAAWGTTAVTVSPGEVTGQRCPTFSWAAADEAVSYRVEMYEQQTEQLLPREVMAAMANPVRTREITAPALTWTPSVSECLSEGPSYVWYVRGTDSNGAGQWSEGKIFRIEAPALSPEQREAIYRVMREYLTSEAANPVQSDPGTTDVTIGAAIDPPSRTAQRKAAAGTTAGEAPLAALPGLAIDANGYVGIGTDAPTSHLHAIGSVTEATASFSSTVTNGTGVEGRANVGTNAWGVYGLAGDGVGVMGRSVSLTGSAGRFENLGGGAAIGASVNSTEVMNVDLSGVHAGPGMTPTPIAHGFFDNTTGSRLSGSSNIICTWVAANTWYTCSILGESFFYQLYTVNVTPTSLCVPITGSASGQLLVQFFNFSGTAIKPSGGFSLTVFKQ